MCIAILNPPRVTLKKETLLTCWKNNPDGAGLIFTDTKTRTLYTLKELNSPEAFCNAYARYRKEQPDSYFVIHFRIATAGKVNKANCHPFVVNQNLAFVHNGIISQARTTANHSDTYHFNLDTLQKLPANFAENSAILDLIESAIGHSKLVFLSSDNKPLILNEYMGHYGENNVWYSNRSYLEKLPPPSLSPYVKTYHSTTPQNVKNAASFWPSYSKGITDLYDV